MIKNNIKSLAQNCNKFAETDPMREIFIVLQHIKSKDVIAYVSEFKRLLNLNGLLVFQLPDRMIYPFYHFIREHILS